jgi:1-acyl-sn-glycerol-3-phosphate acyltransferase
MNRLELWFNRLIGNAICGFARVLTGVRVRWDGCAPVPAQRIYFANHSSHADFALIWSSLPPPLRARTRPVAGADYWLTGRFRRFIGQDVFRAVLVDRDPATRKDDPVECMVNALDHGDSLIVFPEGTRNVEEGLLPFKSGIYHVVRQRPGIDLVPVWIENLNRVMPKGEVLPLPLLCTLTFGAPLRIAAEEAKADFLDRIRHALMSLAPTEHP